MALSVPRYTVEDLERFPDEGNRYELLDGQLLVTPAPGTRHQGVAARLAAELTRQLELGAHMQLYAPGVIKRSPLTHLEPDLLVVPARFQPGVDWEDVTEHWLAVEIFSQSSRVYDREFKRDAYLALGVREVWLVDTRERTIEVCVKSGGGEVRRDFVLWHVPDTELHVSIDLRSMFGGMA